MTSYIELTERMERTFQHWTRRGRQQDFVAAMEGMLLQWEQRRADLDPHGKRDEPVGSGAGLRW